VSVGALWFRAGAFADLLAACLGLRATTGSTAPAGATEPVAAKTGALRRRFSAGRMKRCINFNLIGLIGANLIWGTAILMITVCNGRNCNKMVQRSD
jgi:hypothetical protein